MNKTNYKARILTRISEVSESAWDSHLPTTYHPFLSWKFLHTLEESGCVDETAGWAKIIIRNYNVACPLRP